MTLVMTTSIPTCDRCWKPADRFIKAYWGDELCPQCCADLGGIPFAELDKKGWPSQP